LIVVAPPEVVGALDFLDTDPNKPDKNKKKKKKKYGC